MVNLNIEDSLSSLERGSDLASFRFLEKELKPEVQGPKGLIRSLKDSLDPRRKNEHEVIRTAFINKGDERLSDYDENLNDYCQQMWNVNDRFYGLIKFEYMYFFEKLFRDDHNQQAKYPKIFRSISYSADMNYRQRIQAILGGLVNQSLSQSDKSLAGEAGENLTRTILESVGMKEGIHYRRQFNNGEGSATDFVYPYVKDGEISKVEIFIASQFSSNDRARMASSELQKGGERYLVTGNGMDKSTKALKDIGKEIIQTYKSENIKIVCREKEKQREINRIDGLLASKKANSQELILLEKRRSYIVDYVVTMTSFALKLKSRL